MIIESAIIVGIIGNVTLDDFEMRSTLSADSTVNFSYVEVNNESLVSKNSISSSLFKVIPDNLLFQMEISAIVR